MIKQAKYLSNIAVGERFIYEKEIYLKINHLCFIDASNTVTVNLDTNTIVILNNDTKVLVYENAEITKATEIQEKYDILFSMSNPESPFETLPQYAIDRDVFSQIFSDACEALYDVTNFEWDDFKAWYYSDEWYILHKDSGTLINWYKHCGRTNTCNKVLTIEQYKEFAEMFMNELNAYKEYHHI